MKEKTLFLLSFNNNKLKVVSYNDLEHLKTPFLETEKIYLKIYKEISTLASSKPHQLQSWVILVVHDSTPVKNGDKYQSEHCLFLSVYIMCVKFFFVTLFGLLISLLVLPQFHFVSLQNSTNRIWNWFIFKFDKSSLILNYVIDNDKTYCCLNHDNVKSFTYLGKCFKNLCFVVQ